MRVTGWRKDSHDEEIQLGISSFFWGFLSGIGLYFPAGAKAPMTKRFSQICLFWGWTSAGISLFFSISSQVLFTSSNVFLVNCW